MGASSPTESSSDSPARPRIPPDPEEQWSSVCVRWAAAWLPKMPSKMCPEAWYVGTGLEPDNPAGIWAANLVLMPGSSQL